MAFEVQNGATAGEATPQTKPPVKPVKTKTETEGAE